MRNRLALPISILVASAILVGGCTSTAAPANPYDQLTTSLKTAWSPVQVNVGLTVTAAGQTVTLDPKDLAFVVDEAVQTFALHVSMPTMGFGIPDSALSALGIDGDTVDFDVLYAADALYAKGAFLKPVLKSILGPVGKLPAGDLTGWLKLGTKEELAALSALERSATGMPSASQSPLDAGALRTSLDEIGLSLTTVGVEAHNGTNAQHLKIAFDMAKLAANPSFVAGAGGNTAQVAAMAKAISVSGDVWIDGGSNRVVESDLHVSTTADAPAVAVADVTVTARDPDGSVSLAPPASSIAVPIGTLISQVMKMIGKGAES
ncbi:MAG: hypothetical protein QOE42_842 [Chloroflexota bacterium]|nr:hypothetical protein [Chloroflexota bacterium]